jgi:hypothetical protein
VDSETAKPALVTVVISTLSALLSVEFLRLKKLGIFYQQVMSPLLTTLSNSVNLTDVTFIPRVKKLEFPESPSINSQKHYPILLDTSTHINKGDACGGLRLRSHHNQIALKLTISVIESSKGQMPHNLRRKRYAKSDRSYHNRIA